MVKLKSTVKNLIDQYETLKDQITFNKPERDTKGESRSRKEPKTNGKGKI